MPELAPSGNLLVDSLSPTLRARLAEVMSTVELSLRESICEAGEVIAGVYFPIEGIISNVITMSSGEAIEIGVIGREGMTGVALSLVGGRSPSTLYAQVAGRSLHVQRADMVDIMLGAGAGATQFAAYAEAQLSSLGQYSACNRLHAIDQRFARWLLMAHDRTVGDRIGFTQEFLAMMLGVRRPGVTVAAAALQRAGAISYHRGHITVVDRPALQRASCECYDAVESRFSELLGFSIQKSRPLDALV